MQIPLIIRHPGKIPRGSQSDRIINQYDLFPTLLDYVGMGDKEIADTPGRSFAPLLKGKDINNWGDAAFFEFVTVRVVRTSQWKYMKRLDDEEPYTLYDLKNDPHERHNLVNDPSYSSIVNELDQKLTAFFDKFSDEKYDLWKGGSAKGILLQKYYGRDDIFKSRFPDWKEPTIEKAQNVFTDL